MSAKTFKMAIHNYELSGNYHEIYNLLYKKIHSDCVDNVTYCYIISEIMFILEEIESPFCDNNSLVGKYDLYYDLLSEVLDFGHTKVNGGKCVDWYMCYYIYNYARFHYIIPIFGSVKLVENAAKDMLDHCLIKYSDSMLFSIIPELGMYEARRQFDDCYINQICRELSEFEFEDNYADSEIIEVFEYYLGKDLKQLLIL